MRYGMTIRTPPLARRPPTTTVIRGPFGEMSNHRGGRLALMWYPACLAAVSSDLVPPQDWRMYPDAAVESRMLVGSLEGLAAIVPALRDLDLSQASELSVRGGVITAWGNSDIDDPRSELHRRFEIGVTTTGNYHSVDPGKLTMVPYFAEQCAARIVPD
jgi:hypothetical protein